MAVCVQSWQLRRQERQRKANCIISYEARQSFYFQERASESPVMACPLLDIRLEDLMASVMAWNSTCPWTISLLLNMYLLSITTGHHRNLCSGPKSLAEPCFSSWVLFFTHLDSYPVCEKVNKNTKMLIKLHFALILQKLWLAAHMQVKTISLLCLPAIPSSSPSHH